MGTVPGEFTPVALVFHGMLVMVVGLPPRLGAGVEVPEPPLPCGEAVLALLDELSSAQIWAMRDWDPVRRPKMSGTRRGKIR